MEVLFATTNPAKVKIYADRLEKNGIKLKTLLDLDIDDNVEENGKNSLENATIKAKWYYKLVDMPTIGMDNSLFIEGIDDADQPGTHVRRVHGKRLSDQEMIDYYTGLVKKYGKNLKAKWVYGMAIYDGKDVKTFTWTKGDFYFVGNPSPILNEGYPLDSISVLPDTGKYFVDLTREEKDKYKNKDAKDDDVIKFILQSLNLGDSIKSSK